MSKYEPLWRYIAREEPEKLTFSQIQEIAGVPLDHSFLQHKKDLAAYGFRVAKISMKEKWVRFEKEPSLCPADTGEF